ncbi:MAG: hypothetical protein ACD_45C00719G0006, partial [uncultured bacterium]
GQVSSDKPDGRAAIFSDDPAEDLGANTIVLQETALNLGKENK